MRAFLTVFGCLFLSSAHAASLDVENNRIVLLSLKIDATQSEVRQTVECNEEQTKAAVLNLVSFSATKDNSERRLQPTMRPLDNEAAWMLQQDQCPSLKPYLSGVGFKSYDRVTGKAEIYLAAFNVKRHSDSEWRKYDKYTRMRMIFQPEYDVINVVTFPAKCEVVRVGKFARLGFGDIEFQCALDDGKGLLRFAIR